MRCLSAAVLGGTTTRPSIDKKLGHIWTICLSPRLKHVAIMMTSFCSSRSPWIFRKRRKRPDAKYAQQETTSWSFDGHLRPPTGGLVCLLYFAMV